MCSEEHTDFFLKQIRNNTKLTLICTTQFLTFVLSGASKAVLGFPSPTELVDRDTSIETPKKLHSSYLLDILVSRLNYREYDDFLL